MKPLNCIICDKELEPAAQMLIDDPASDQPYDATSFISHGQYGSTVFDPFDSSYLIINICDECMLKKAEEGKIRIGYSYQRTHHEPLETWRGQGNYISHIHGG